MNNENTNDIDRLQTLRECRAKLKEVRNTLSDVKNDITEIRLLMIEKIKLTNKEN